METEAKPALKSKSNKIRLIALAVFGICCLVVLGVLLVILLFKPFKDDKTSSQSGGDSNTPVTGQGDVINDNPQCSLPVVEYKANAFSIGVPKGWIYNVDSGTVSIMQDESNTTAVFLYTAKLYGEMTASDFLDQFKYIFQKTIEDVNGTFNTGSTTTEDAIAQTEINASIGSDNMKGLMKVELKNGFVVLKSYWAPASELESKRPLLEEITNCFARIRILTDDALAGNYTEEGVLREEKTSNMGEYKGKYFKLNKPADFNVMAETDSGIDLTRSDDNAGFSYAYATGFVGSYTPKTWTEKALPEYAGISNLSLSNEQSITSPINGQVIKSFDFTGELNKSIPVRGKVTVGIFVTPYTGFGTQYSSAFWGIQIATPEVWAGVRSTLQAIQDSVQIIDIGNTRRNTLLPPNRPIESVSASKVTSNNSYSSSLEKTSEEKWADAMRGYETVESPSTGQRYDVPLNSWSEYGPDGPGYYRSLPDDSLEKLQ